MNFTASVYGEQRKENQICHSWGVAPIMIQMHSA